MPAVPSWCKPAMAHRCRFPCAADHAFSRSPKLFSVSHTEKNTKRMRIFFFPFGNLSTPMFKAAAISDTCTAKHGALSGSHLLVVLPTNLVLTPYVLWDRHPGQVPRLLCVSTGGVQLWPLQRGIRLHESAQQWPPLLHGLIKS